MRPPCIETVTALALLAVPAASAQQALVTRPLDSASVVRLHLVQGSRVEAELVTTFAPESGVIVYRPPFHRDCGRSEEHTSELQSHSDLVCRLLLEKKKKKT